MTEQFNQTNPFYRPAAGDTQGRPDYSSFNTPDNGSSQAIGAYNPAARPANSSPNAAQLIEDLVLNVRRTMVFGLGKQGRAVLEALEQQMLERWGRVLPTTALVVIEDKDSLQPWLDGLTNTNRSRLENFIPVPLEIPSQEDLSAFGKHISEWLPVQIKFVNSNKQAHSQNNDQTNEVENIDEATRKAAILMPEEPSAEGDDEFGAYVEDLDYSEFNDIEINQIRLDRKAARWRGRVALVGSNIKKSTYAMLEDAMRKAHTRVSDGRNDNWLSKLNLKNTPNQYDAYVVASLDDPVVSGMVLDFAYLLNFYFQPGSSQQLEDADADHLPSADFQRNTELPGGFLSDKDFFTPRAVIMLPDFGISNDKQKAVAVNQSQSKAEAELLESYRASEEEDELDVQKRAKASAYAFFRELDYYMDSAYNNVRYELTYTSSTNSTVVVRGTPPFQACYLLERTSSESSNTVSRDDVTYVVSAWLHQMSVGPLYGFFVAGEDAATRRVYRRISAYNSLGLASLSSPFKAVGEYIGLDLAAQLIGGVLAPPPPLQQGQSDADRRATGFFNQEQIDVRSLVDSVLDPGLVLPVSGAYLQISPEEFVSFSAIRPEEIDEQLKQTLSERTGERVFRPALKLIKNRYEQKSQQMDFKLNETFKQRLDGAPTRNNWAVLQRTAMFLQDLQNLIKAEQQKVQTEFQPLDQNINDHLTRAAYRRAQLYQLANVFVPKAYAWQLIVSGLMMLILTVFVGLNLLLSVGLSSKNNLLIGLGGSVILLMVVWVGFCIWETFNQLSKARNDLVDEYKLALETVYRKVKLKYCQNLYEQMLGQVAGHLSTLGRFDAELRNQLAEATNRLNDSKLNQAIERSANPNLQMDSSVMDVPKTIGLVNHFLGLQPDSDYNQRFSVYSAKLEAFYAFQGSLSSWCLDMSEARPDKNSQAFGLALKIYCTNEMEAVARKLRLEDLLTKEADMLTNRPEKERLEQLQKLYNMAHPLWRTNTTNLEPKPPEESHYIAVENEDRSPSEELLRNRYKLTKFSTGDYHRLTIVDKQVGLPLLALTQLPELRRAYNEFKKGGRRRYLHTSKAHIALPDVVPLNDVDGSPNRDWLEKDVQLLFALARVFGSIQFDRDSRDGKTKYFFTFQDRYSDFASNPKAVAPVKQWLSTTRAESAADLIDNSTHQQIVLDKLTKLDIIKNPTKLRQQGNRIVEYLKLNESSGDCDTWELVKLRQYLDMLNQQNEQNKRNSTQAASDKKMQSRQEAAQAETLSFSTRRSFDDEDEFSVPETVVTAPKTAGNRKPRTGAETAGEAADGSGTPTLPKTPRPRKNQRADAVNVPLEVETEAE